MSDATSRPNAALEGRYAIERELGEGGMATVYLADDLTCGRNGTPLVCDVPLFFPVGAPATWNKQIRGRLRDSRPSTPYRSPQCCKRFRPRISSLWDI